VDRAGVGQGHLADHAEVVFSPRPRLLSLEFVMVGVRDDAAVATPVLRLVEGLSGSPINIRVRRQETSEASIVWYVAGLSDTVRTEVLAAGQWRLLAFPTNQLPAFLCIDGSLEPERLDQESDLSMTLSAHDFDGFMRLIADGKESQAVDALTSREVDTGETRRLVSALIDSGETVEILILSPEDAGERSVRAAVITWLNAPGVGLFRIDRLDGLRPDEPPASDSEVRLSATTDQDLFVSMMTSLAEAGGMRA